MWGNPRISSFFLSHRAKYQAFLCGERNLVLSDGGVARWRSRRACDFYGRVWLLLCSDDVRFLVGSEDDESQLPPVGQIVIGEERQRGLLQKAVVVELCFRLADGFPVHADVLHGGIDADWCSRQGAKRDVGRQEMSIGVCDADDSGEGLFHFYEVYE